MGDHGGGIESEAWRALNEIGQTGLPDFDSQGRKLLKVSVACDQGKFFLLRNGGDPNVILRYRASFFAQLGFQLAVRLRGPDIAGPPEYGFGEFSKTRQVMLD